MISLTAILKIMVAILKMENIALASIDFVTRKVEEQMLKVSYLYPEVHICCKKLGTSRSTTKTNLLLKMFSFVAGVWN